MKEKDTKRRSFGMSFQKGSTVEVDQNDKAIQEKRGTHGLNHETSSV